LTNSDFAQGTEGWWSGTSKTMAAAGCKQGVEEGRWVAHIPDSGCTEATGILFGHEVNLEGGRTYRLSYTLTTERPGTMRHLYQLSDRPWSPLGLVADVPVPAGTTEVEASFTCSRVDADAHLTFNLSRLAGKVVIGNVRLEEIAELPVSALGESWLVFADVEAPPFSDLRTPEPGGPAGDAGCPPHGQAGERQVARGRAEGETAVPHPGIPRAR